MNNKTMTLQDLIEVLEEYLFENYQFRHNVLSDKFEIRELKDETTFRTLSREAFNTLAHRIKKDGLEIPNLKQNLEEYIYSEETPAYDPIQEYLNGQPIYGRTQQDRRRFASFVSTTNKPRPLTDQTDSSRFLCIQIDTAFGRK